MAALHLNVSELNYYGPHEEMFASKIKTIQGQQLSNFLRQMDQTEYGVLVRESAEIITLWQGGVKAAVGFGGIAGFLGGVIACSALGPVGILGGLAAAYGGGYFGHHYGNTIGNNVPSKIIADRTSRLFQKQMAIQGRISELNQANNRVEIEQLRIVEHYFHLQQVKWEAHLAAVHHTVTVNRN